MTQLLLFNVTNGLIIGAFYVLMALGLSLILNLSSVINFAHGGFLVIGGYIAYTITPYLGFWGALLVAPPLTAIVGLVVERVLIRPLYGRDPLYSLLLTFGLAFMVEDGTRFIWGPQGKPVTIPPFLAQPLSNELFFITGYRLFMVAVVMIAVALLFLLLRYTRLGIGSLPGTLVGGLLIGVASGLTAVFLPAASEAVIYVLMAVVLLLRPRGLFGEEGMMT